MIEFVVLVPFFRIITVLSLSRLKVLNNGIPFQFILDKLQI